jgi:hypothetical protein
VVERQHQHKGPQRAAFAAGGPTEGIGIQGRRQKTMTKVKVAFAGKKIRPGAGAEEL